MDIVCILHELFNLRILLSKVRKFSRYFSYGKLSAKLQILPHKKEKKKKKKEFRKITSLDCLSLATIRLPSTKCKFGVRNLKIKGSKKQRYTNLHVERRVKCMPR